MAAEMEVHLRNVRLYGYHGMVKGEEIVGGEFEVSLTVTYVPARINIIEIEDTVDYTSLLELIRVRMQRPSLLLESLATEIAEEILNKYPIVRSIEITILKLNPPIRNFEGAVGVTYKINNN